MLIGNACVCVLQQWWAEVAGDAKAKLIRQSDYLNFSTRVFEVLTGDKASGLRAHQVAMVSACVAVTRREPPANPASAAGYQSDWEDLSQGKPAVSRGRFVSALFDIVVWQLACVAL